jgi:hypothetical protein
MQTLTASILGIVLAAAAIAVLAPGNTPGVLLAIGAPFALFANVMASESPGAKPASEAGAALLIDWM